MLYRTSTEADFLYCASTLRGSQVSRSHQFSQKHVGYVKWYAKEKVVLTAYRTCQPRAAIVPTVLWVPMPSDGLLHTHGRAIYLPIALSHAAIKCADHDSPLHTPRHLWIIATHESQRWLEKRF